MDKLILSERDIFKKCITPAIQLAGWQQHEFREEVQLTDGRVMVRSNLAARIKNPEVKGGPNRADYVLYARPAFISLSWTSKGRRACSQTPILMASPW